MLKSSLHSIVAVTAWSILLCTPVDGLASRGRKSMWDRNDGRSARSHDSYVETDESQAGEGYGSMWERDVAHATKGRESLWETDSTRAAIREREPTWQRDEEKARYSPRRDRSKQKRSAKPNIVLIMADDQDSELGSMNFMPKTLRLLQDGGATFSNSFVTTPMCCPSRSSMLTGMYVHNHNVYTNNDNCSSVQWQQTFETRNFATYLSNAGYRTGYFGKYLNEYEGTYIPPGWSEWVGLVRNTRYYNYTLNFNGKKIKHGDNYYKDYLTDLIANDSVTFLKQSKQYFPNRPVAMVLSMPAPHGPEDAAPQYQHLFPNVTTHRTPSWNYAPNPDKQWILQYTGKMEPIHSIFTDMLQRKRVQTLQSVDDAVEKIYNEMRQLGEEENTYFIYTSDHGYHLGQYGLVKGKAMPYDFDIRVPFYMRGPKIPTGIRVPNIVLNVDIAPTMLDIGGIAIPDHMDGRSILKLFDDVDDPGSIIGRTLKRKKAWRDTFLVERGKITNKKIIHRERLEAKKNNLVVTKEQRLEEECNKAEYQPPCKGKQQWACAVNGSGKLRMYKCRNEEKQNDASPTHTCKCAGMKIDVDKSEMKLQRQFLKDHVNQPKMLKPRFLRNRRHLFTASDDGTADPSSQEEEDTDDDFLEQRSPSLTEDQDSDQAKPTELVPVNMNKRKRKHRKKSERQSESPDSQLDNEGPRQSNKKRQKMQGDLFGDLSEWDWVSEERSAREKQKEFGLVDVGMPAVATEERPRVRRDSEQELSSDYINLDSLPVSCRVLPNNTVVCNEEIYEDFYLWKTQKSELDRRIQEYRDQLEALKDVRKHLKKVRPSGMEGRNSEAGTATWNEEMEGGDSGEWMDVEKEGLPKEEPTDFSSTDNAEHSEHEENKNYGMNTNREGLEEPGEGGEEYWDEEVEEDYTDISEYDGYGEDCDCDSEDTPDERQGLSKRERKRMERRQKRKERKDRKRKRKDDKEDKHRYEVTKDCNSPSMKCFTQDNTHWRTPPFWDLGPFCFCPNSNNNTYWCLRTINETHNFLYCEFITGFISFYDMTSDPYQLRNAVHNLNFGILQQLHGTLEKLKGCKGVRECTIRTRPQEAGRVTDLMEESSGEADRSGSGADTDLLLPRSDLDVNIVDTEYSGEIDPRKEDFLWLTDHFRLDRP